jgi:hypothetical protein
MNADVLPSTLRVPPAPHASTTKDDDTPDGSGSEDDIGDRPLCRRSHRQGASTEEFKKIDYASLHHQFFCKL